MAKATVCWLEAKVKRLTNHVDTARGGRRADRAHEGHA